MGPDRQLFLPVHRRSARDYRLRIPRWFFVRSLAEKESQLHFDLSPNRVKRKYRLTIRFSNKPQYLASNVFPA